MFFFLPWGNVCIFDRIFKGAQDSSERVKNHSLVGKISYSHEAVTTRQEVSCRVYTVGVHCVQKRERLSAGLFGEGRMEKDMSGLILKRWESAVHCLFIA